MTWVDPGYVEAEKTLKCTGQVYSRTRTRKNPIRLCILLPAGGSTSSLHADGFPFLTTKMQVKKSVKNVTQVNTIHLQQPMTATPNPSSTDQDSMLDWRKKC